MPIPDFNADGTLPQGVHECSLAELESRFGQYQSSDRRCRLFEKDEGEPEYQEYVDFFAQVRSEPGQVKGMVEVAL